MHMQQLAYNPTHGAHAKRDFKDRGTRYIVGDSFPLDGIDSTKIQRLYTAGLIEYGPPTEKRKAMGDARRAQLKAEADAKAKAAPPTVDLTDAELEAATAPEPRRASGKPRR